MNLKKILTIMMMTMITLNETETTLEPSSSSSWKDDTNNYLILLGERSKDLDNVYSVRKLTKDRLMIGDSPISFSQNNIHVANLNFPKSKGLLELLFKKGPEESVVSTDDQRNYGKIINATNAYKKHYKTDGEVRDSKAFK